LHLIIPLLACSLLPLPQTRTAFESALALDPKSKDLQQALAKCIQETVEQSASHLQGSLFPRVEDLARRVQP
jgi:hypothetical protein